MLAALSDNFYSLVSIFILAAIHLWAGSLRFSNWIWHSAFLSLAGGISTSYVFIKLLPELCHKNEVLKMAALPFIEKHAFLLALAGFLFFYGLDFFENQKGSKTKLFTATLAGYSIFNFLVGYSLADINDPDVRPYYLFTFAMGLHYFVNDHEYSEKFVECDMASGRKILAGALMLGWIMGYWTSIPEPLVALMVAFIAGGVIMNVMRHQLKKSEQHAFLFFSIGSLFYSIILLIKPSSN